MAKYNFDELVKKANQGQGLYTKSSEKTEEEAEKILQQMAFTMNILDGQETEHGGQFDYFIDMKNRTWEKTDWSHGFAKKENGVLSEEAVHEFSARMAFVLTLPQKQFVTNTRSSGINRSLWDKEKYGPIRRYSRIEMRMGDKFIRFVPGQDTDTPFPEIAGAVKELRSACR